ncbi:hypothetical protein [Crassaminicella thermophila]|uniref:hypothetical protein n=1 Tax=Crassaminicella thermophila TaxID=2599308 RepID=UPI00143D50B8|nr:hypothetical protein [Crassaminicella thermophila]
MEKLIRKGYVEQNKFFSFYFIWGYFYFSAGYLFYKKIINLFSNEDDKILCIVV